VTNISNQVITVADLAISIPPRATVNLLDKRHYSCTPEQIIASIKTGSISKRRNKLFPRISPPEQKDKSMAFLRDNALPIVQRSLFKIEHKNFAELANDDESFAEENSDLAAEDDKPSVAPVLVPKG
jgi:hypothetical protein